MLIFGHYEIMFGRAMGKTPNSREGKGEGEGQASGEGRGKHQEANIRRRGEGQTSGEGRGNQLRGEGQLTVIYP